MNSPNSDKEKERDEMLQKSKKEMDLVVNFLREGQYLDPETSILKKDNRENFFDNFHEEQTVYHLFNKWDHHELKCYMLIPKTLDKTRKIPFHVLFHGGGLTTGGGNYVHWFSDYKRDLAIDANAITLIPMHRLMPEDSGEEIYADVITWWDFYQSERLDAWVEDCFKDHGQNECITKLSKNNLLVSGESAGGLLAVYSWLFSVDLHIQVLYLQYPMLNFYKKTMPEDGVEYMGRKISAEEVKQRADALIKVVNRQRDEDRIVSRSDSKPPIGMAAAMLLSNTQQWQKCFQGKSRPEQPLDAPGYLLHNRRNKILPDSFPKIFIIHGTNDTACPIQDTKDFVKILDDPLERWDCVGKAKLEKFEGQGHAFDYEVKGKPFEGQINDVMKSVLTAWLS